MKKLLSVILSIFLCALFTLPAFCEENNAVLDSVTAKSCVLMDLDSGEILLAKNENEQLPPASITKIMTLILCFEALDNGMLSLDDTVTASTNASQKGGSQIWLKENETMTVHELLKATAIASANDACTALGEKLAGDEEAFVVMMNEKAKKLGLENTRFENCSGLDDTTENHYSSALDIAIMSRELMKHEKVKEYTTIWMDSLRDGATQLVNTNKLIRFYEGATGLKTGTTSKAGYCISATAERNGVKLCAVILGADTGDHRFEDAKKLLNYGFANYTVFTPEFDETLITNVNVLYGKTNEIVPKIIPAQSSLLPKGSETSVTQRVDICVDVEAPVEKGQILGYIYYEMDGKEIAKSPIISEESVERKTFAYILYSLWSSFSVMK
ncbi:MAG: D-alanyl-D-alanine carboxypeptidase [Oscillospiraceae bacterium]|nr:D-alanyl-D-alanine carboxypeptidase [Oscillospiraceae bacterium]